MRDPTTDVDSNQVVLNKRVQGIESAKYTRGVHNNAGWCCGQWGSPHCYIMDLKSQNQLNLNSPRSRSLSVLSNIHHSLSQRQYDARPIIPNVQSQRKQPSLQPNDQTPDRRRGMVQWPL